VSSPHKLQAGLQVEVNLPQSSECRDFVHVSHTQILTLNFNFLVLS
jgi:hypothetical protein